MPPLSFEGAFSLSFPWGGTISSMGWSNPLHPMEQQEKRHFSQTAKKKKQISLFCARLFVTLSEFAGFLCIKAMQRIEKFWGYDLETVLNSLFCYKLPERAPDSDTPPVSWLVVGCKGRHNISYSQMFSGLIYSPITPSLLPHCGAGQKVTTRFT